MSVQRSEDGWRGAGTSDLLNQCRNPTSMPRRPKSYRVIAVSLYNEEATEIDRLTQVLRRAGIENMSRSQLVREAVRCLNRELAGKPSREIVRYFLDRQAGRAIERSTTNPDVDIRRSDDRSTQ